jgi:alpha-L-rhamnosidase
MKSVLSKALLVLVMILGIAGTVFSEITITETRCEYARNPIGIDVLKPRLSWKMASDVRGQKQTAYQILVASSPELLREDKSDLWNSGKIKSDNSVQVEYNGKELTSGLRCYWTVRVWDKDDKPSNWSKAAFWEMGLLNPEDWKAEWISFTSGDSLSEVLSGLNWIWFPEGDPRTSAPAEARFFRKTIIIPSGANIKDAMAFITADDQFILYINGQEVAKSVQKDFAWRQLTEINIKPFLAEGTNTLAIKAINRQGPAGLIGVAQVVFANNQVLTIAIDSSWKAANIEQNGWLNAGFDDKLWPQAKELCRFGDGPWQGMELSKMGPCPYFRKTVDISKPIKRARLYASALGLYEFYINGKRVGVDFFTPGWTDYNIRVQYQTYDVTDLLNQGKNGLGIILGDGWYCGYVGLGGRNRYGQFPMAIAQLNLEYTDGSKEIITTDKTWKANFGPIQQSDMLMGEIYDARKEIQGWALADFKDQDWGAVRVCNPRTKLVATVDDPVRKTQELKPIKITEPTQGVYVFDMGQNMVGWARLKVSAPQGTSIRLRFAEMLNPDGTIYTANLRSAKCTDLYICNGRGIEVYEPRFTYHGFRYVELSGLPKKPALDTITGIVLHSDTPPTGKFECSDPLINKLQSNIVWGQRGNFFSVPTDCPQRDERLGWMGDAQIFIRTAAFNMDVSRFFTKWMIDVEDAQRPDGAFTDVSPFVAAGAGTAAWGDAGLICPWAVYVCYADKRILERHYQAGVRWIEYLKAHSKNLIRPAEGYGDWLSIQADTPKDVLATAYFALSARLMENFANVLGKVDDALKYHQLFEDIKQAFNKEFVTEDGRIKGNTQTCYVLALAFDLLPASKQGAAAKYLVDDIRKHENHLTTGFVGVGHLMPVLTKAGYTSVAYELLHQETFPSWLYSILQGATTIWERWDGWTKEKGFQDPGMNSFNHYSLGSVGRWMYENIGGIAPYAEFPGYKHVIIHPRPGGKITYAKAEYDSVHGLIKTDWRIIDGRFELSVQVPVNTTASVYIPCNLVGLVKEGGKQVFNSETIQYRGVDDGCSVFEVGSGIYKFEAPLTPLVY